MRKSELSRHVLECTPECDGPPLSIGIDGQMRASRGRGQSGCYAAQGALRSVITWRASVANANSSFSDPAESWRKIGFG